MDTGNLRGGGREAVMGEMHNMGLAVHKGGKASRIMRRICADHVPVHAHAFLVQCVMWVWI